MMSNGAIGRVEAIAREFLSHGSFRPEDVELDAASAARFVKYAGNPIRFLPKMFDSDWVVPGVRPAPGAARVLRVVVARDGVAQVIVRQGPSLYIYSYVPPRVPEEPDA